MKTKIELSNGQIVKLSQKELAVLEKNCEKILGEVQQMNDWVSDGARSNYSEAALETFAQASVEKDETKKKNLINKLFEKWSVDQLEKYSITNFEYFTIGQNGKIQHRYEDLLETSKEMISTGKLTKPDAEKLTYSLESLMIGNKWWICCIILKPLLQHTLKKKKPRKKVLSKGQKNPGQNKKND